MWHKKQLRNASQLFNKLQNLYFEGHTKAIAEVKHVIITSILSNTELNYGVLLWPRHLFRLKPAVTKDKSSLYIKQETKHHDVTSHRYLNINHKEIINKTHKERAHSA